MSSDQLLYSAVVGLAAAVVFLFGLVTRKNAAQDKRIEEKNAAQDKRIEDCEADRTRLNAEVMKQKDHLIEVWRSLAEAGIKPAQTHKEI